MIEAIDRADEVRVDQISITPRKSDLDRGCRVKSDIETPVREEYADEGSAEAP